jgi:hypothetical protein
LASPPSAKFRRYQILWLQNACVDVRQRKKRAWRNRRTRSSKNPTRLLPPNQTRNSRPSGLRTRAKGREPKDAS